ncbi:Asp-tRNA(Asn)/Glu-tRNA(Gln) amidotransferase subunit GatA [Candidatus Parcubacteria bacterium]|nr:Asp-tRNA(Asn)/Glu-tRNA(Gln) amidotransferase subunit GatA [Candidatus Parcubacteria bacterium]
MEIKHLTIKEINQGLKNKEFSAKDILEFYIKQIEKKEGEINAFISTSFDLARKQAQEIDQKIAQGQDLDILAGVPMAIKDNILVQGLPATAGSKILKDYQASYDATVVERLKRKGAVILGKLNMDEFAMGSSGEYSSFGKTKNPRDLKRVPGGSSSGAAAAVAADMCVYALGSETGGSTRQPASFCGIVGLKPTYGSVSRYGLMALASSLDQIGVLAKNSSDVKIVFDAIKGIDQKDSTSVESDLVSNNNFDISKIKIGIPKEYFIEGIEPEVKKAVEEAIDFFKKSGAKIVEISLPNSKYALACYQILMTAEASSNLARYDNIRYGNRDFLAKGLKSLEQEYSEFRKEGFGKEASRRIMLGTYVLSAGYYDAYYLRAQKIRTLIINDFKKAFEEIDLIITPTAPTTAFEFGQRLKDPVTMYLADIFTSSANLAGIPGISIPCHKKDQLPIGLQIMGDLCQEDKIFRVAEFFEKNNK